MKNTIKYLSGLLLMGFVASCQPDEFDGANIAGLPEANNYKVVATVDQSINQVVIDLVDANNQPAKGVYPIVTIVLPDGKTVEKTTTSGYTNIFVKSGDYKVTAKVGNRNGVSDGELTTIFHMDNSIVDYTKYYTMISKETWYLDNTAKGHLACGETIDNPAGWWAAGPDEKAAFGVYDNALTFTAEGKYTFNPGEAGTVYANKCVTALGVTDATEDYTVEAAEATYEYSFDTEGDDLILILQAKSWFPYIASDQIYETPRYKVVSMTTKAMTLVSYQKTSANPDGIAWQYILSTSHEVKFTGFKYNSEFNLWKAIDETKDYTNSTYYAHGGNWEGYPEGSLTYAQNGSEYTVNLPFESNDRWQAQFFIIPTALQLEASKTYDVSIVLQSSTDLAGATIKIPNVADNGPVLLEARPDLTAFEDYVFYATDMPGFDDVAKLVFDFGGNKENTTVTIKNIVIKDHANDDGTVLPSEEPTEDPSTPQVSWTGKNLLADMPIEITQWYAPGWNQIADAEYTAKDGVYTIKYPEAASDQWMAQFTFNNTGIALDPAKSYDFRVKMVSSADHPGVTVKITQQDDDNTFITEGRHPLVAFEETWIELSDLKFVVNGEGKGVIDNLKMPFDFGGVAEGTEITISDMHLQEHQEGPKAFAWDLTGEKNLWLKGTHETLSYYYAPGWNKIDDPVGVIDGNKYTITLPTATDDQPWQAQWHISTELGKADISADKKYNIRFTIESNQDLPGVTFKLTENGNDDNFLTADRHAVVAFEETTIELMDLTLPKGDITNETFKLALDFAGNPADTEVTIKDIIIQEAE